MGKAPDSIIEKAIIRCKKAQHMTKSFQDKKKIKTGKETDKRLTAMVNTIQRNEDYGELGGELQVLMTMVNNMKYAILEPLADSIETIERRMVAYKKAIDDNINSVSDLEAASTANFSASVANLNFAMTHDEEAEEDHASLGKKNKDRPGSKRQASFSGLANGSNHDRKTPTTSPRPANTRRNSSANLAGGSSHDRKSAVPPPKILSPKAKAGKRSSKTNGGGSANGNGQANGDNTSLNGGSNHKRSSRMSSQYKRLSQRNISAFQELELDDNDDDAFDVDILTPFENINPESSAVTAKQQKFFARLGQFFENIVSGDERNIVVDPHCKLANMKVKSHTKGLLERDGVTHKQAYQQQDLRGRRVKTLSDLYGAAEQAESSFKTLITQLVDSVNGLSAQDIIFSPIKRRVRASEKAQEQFAFRNPGPGESWIFDVVRAGIVCKTIKQMSDVNKWFRENIHIVDCNNRFAIPRFDGYRDIIYHISVPYKDELAHTCEVQVHHRDFKLHFGISSNMPFFRPYFAESTGRNQENVLGDLDILHKVGRIDDEFMEFLMNAEDPDQVKLFGRLFFEHLGETERSLELFKRVLVMEETTIGKDHVKTAATYILIGMVLLKQTDTDGSLLYLREGFDIYKQKLGDSHPQVAAVHASMGTVYIEKGHYNTALKEHQMALQIRERLLGEDHLLVAESYSCVGHCLAHKGETKRALDEYQTALLVQQSVLGEKHEDVAPTHASIGRMHLEQGDLGQAKESFQTALSIRESALGKTHPSVAESMTCLGDLEYRQEHYIKAEQYYRKALQIRENVQGTTDHPDCAASMIQMGKSKCKSSSKDGIETIRKAITILINELGKTNVTVADAFEQLGHAYEDTHNYGAALQCYKHVLTIRKSIHGKNHPSTAVAMNCIATIKLKTKKAADIPLGEYEKSMSILVRIVTENHPLVADTYQCIGDVYIVKCNQGLALENFSKALSIRNSLLGKYHPKTAESCNQIAELLLRKNDIPGAKMAYRQALAAAVHLYGEQHLQTATARLNMGRLYNEDHEFDDAQNEFERAVTIRKAMLGTEDLGTAEAHYWLGSVHNRQGSFEDAMRHHKIALRIRQEHLEPNHADIKASKAGIKATESQKYEDEIAL